MRLRPLVRSGLGFAALVSASTIWVAVVDRHWAAIVVLGILALGCAYPAITGRDPFDPRHRKHRRHRSRRHAAPIVADAPSSEPPTPEP